MQNKLLIFVICSLVVWPTVLVYGENYQLKIDDHVYDITYQVDGNVIAMAIDQELTSFLIGTENVNDSLFEINLQHEMINAENNEFAILVNGYETDYEIMDTGSSSKLTFFVPTGTQEIEIIGTYVIPEFPLGILFVFVILTTVVVLSTSKMKILK